MLRGLVSLLDRLTENTEPQVAFSEQELRLAVAALLVHAARIDDHYSAREQSLLHGLLQQHFDLSPDDADQLLHEAATKEGEAADLYGFTKILTARLDQDGRRAIILMLWHVAWADENLHEYEDNLVWRVAELIGVSREDRLTLKQEALRSAEDSR